MKSCSLDLSPLRLVERVRGDAVPASDVGVAWREGEEAVEHLAIRAPAADTSRHWRQQAGAVETTRIPSVRPKADRLGLMVTRGREVEQLAPHVWAVPHWRLFGPAE